MEESQIFSLDNFFPMMLYWAGTMGQSIYFVIATIFLSSLSSSFTAIDSQIWEGKIVQENGVTIIENPSHPVLKKDVLDLSNIFTIPGNDKDGRYVIYQITDMAVDQNGQIYIYDRKGSSILVFDQNGHFLRKFGRSGAGPGELSGVSEIEAYKGEIFAINSAGRRVVVLSDKGIFIKSFMAPGNLAVFRADERGHFFAKMFSQQVYHIIQCSPDFKIENTLTTRKWEEPRFWQNLISYELDGSGNVIVGKSPDYQLLFYNGQGKLIKIIKKSYKPIKIPKAKIDFLKDKNATRWTIPTEYDPFYNIYSDSRGKVIVNTHIFLAGPQKAFYDVFDEEGKFLAAFSLKYYRQLIWKYDRLYAADEDEEGFPIVRAFKVQWNLK